MTQSVSSIKEVNKPKVLSTERKQSLLLDHLRFYILIFLDQLELSVQVVRNMVQSLRITFLDSHRLYSQSIRIKLMRPSKSFQKEFKMKKVFAFHLADQIMVENLKIILLKISAMKMAFLIISLLLKLLNKMGLLKGRIDLYKKWPESCFQKVVCQNICGQKQLTLLTIFQTMFS